MKILVIGGGGREHALVWAFGQSARVTEVVCAPGNGGIAGEARCVAVDVTDVAAMVRLVEAEAPGLTVVGPEVPLSLGVVDALQARGLRVFGPTRAAARLESSKAFAKDFMGRHGIPTAAYAVCSTMEEVRAELARFAVPVVVKADGLAAGKGVVICATYNEALKAAEDMFSGQLLGAAETQIVLEEFLVGEEVSFFAICDGRRAVALAAAQDHKRIGEGDTGPNTGGMGAYSTDTLLSDPMKGWLTEHVAQRVVEGMVVEGTPFVGVLFCGMMMVQGGTKEAVRPMVLEFNTRFGDPETQAVLMRLETDLLSLLEAAVEGDVGRVAVRMRPGASVCVVAASGGYPGRYVGGKVITGLTSEYGLGVKVFHSGTALDAVGAKVTAGGRVLGATAVSESGLADALALAYGALGGITFEGMQYRRDIGWRALGNSGSVLPKEA